MGARQVDEETIRRWIAEGIGDSPGGSSYLVWNGKLAQTGTGAPTLNSNGSGAGTPYRNTLGGTVVWSRSDVGYFLGTLAGAFATASKVEVIVAGVLGGSTRGSVDSENAVAIETYFGENPSDDLLNDTSVEIRVWP